ELSWPVVNKPNNEIRHVDLVAPKSFTLDCTRAYQIGEGKNLFDTIDGSFRQGLPGTQPILLFLIMKVASARVRDEDPRSSENSGLRGHRGSFANVEG